MYEMEDKNMMSGTLGDTAVEGGYLNIKLHDELVAKIYVPPPFWEDKYRDSINENDDYFSDDAGNSYDIYIWSAMGDISYEIHINSIEDEKYFKDFKNNVVVNFEGIFLEDFEQLQEEYEEIKEEDNKTKFFINFSKELEVLKNLNQLNIKDDLENIAYRKMLFINIITLLEVYLGDVFRLSIAKNSDYLKLAIEKIRELSSERIPLKEFFKEQYTPLSYAEKVINSKILFHKIEKVNEIFKAVFGLKILNDSNANIIDLVQIRHDFVHRNKTSKKIDISQAYIDSIIKEIETYLLGIDLKLYEKVS